MNVGPKTILIRKATMTNMLTRHQPPGDAPVLDTGASTGIMGKILTALGYSNIARFDATEGMLAHAAAVDIY